MSHGSQSLPTSTAHRLQSSRSPQSTSRVQHQNLNERDRQAYQTFLEVQLERVTKACTKATHSSDIIASLQK